MVTEGFKMKYAPPRGVLVALFVLASAASGSALAEGGTKAVIHGDPVRGQLTAEKWCVSCHNIGTKSANDQIPALNVVALRHSGQPAVLRAFLHAPHKPMPPLQLTNQEIEDLAVFIERLN